jgi:hypothetical protein
MTIVGFNFSKILAQQKKATKGNLKIGTNVKIDVVEKTSLGFDKDRSALRAGFTYKVTYEPEIGIIEFQGDILFMESQKIIDELVSEWNAKKQLPKKFSAALMTTIMQKCIIQALVISKDIGLPPPIQLPKVKVAEEEEAPKPAVKSAKK